MGLSVGVFMTSMHYVLAAAVLGVAAPAQAQVAAPPVLRSLYLAPNTELVVTPDTTVSSQDMRVGDRFAISTVSDVLQQGHVVIPRGTPGQAVVTRRSGKGAWGKTGKMDVAFEWLDLNGHHIPLTGTYHQEGQGNTGAVVGAVIAVGLVGAAFVTGHSASLEHGQLLAARTVEVLAISVPGASPALASLTAPAFAAGAPALAPQPALASAVTPAQLIIPANGDNVVMRVVPSAYGYARNDSEGAVTTQPVPRAY